MANFMRQHNDNSLPLVDNVARAVVVGMLLVLSFAFARIGLGAEDIGGEPVTGFRVFDATFYTSKPALDHYGVEPIEIIYSGSLWPKKSSRETPNDDQVRRFVRWMHRERSPKLVVVDIEHWPVYNVPPVRVHESIGKFSRVVGIIREEAPGLQLGLYGVLPIRDYWTPVLNDPQRMSYWRAANARLHDLASNVDAIFPSLYTFYDRPDEWKKYAEASLLEARRYGKPVYAFLWPRFHESNKRLGGSLVSGAFWRLQLEVARQHADGVVIWDSARKPWRENAPWWKETKKFLRTQRIQTQ